MPKYAFLFIAALLTAFIVEGFSAAPLLADLRITTDLEYIGSDTETTSKETGETSDSEYSRFTQLYGLDISRRIFPYLYFNVGGLFELTDVENTTDGASTESDEKVKRPYVELLLSNPLYRAGLDYRKTDIERTTSTLEENRTLEEYSGRLGWRPIDLPQVDLNYTRSQISNESILFLNEDRDTNDQDTDDFELKSRYQYQDWFFNYFFTYSDADFHNVTRSDSRTEIEDSNRLTTSHNGTVQYTRNFLANRMTLDAGARLFKTNIELSGIGEVQQRSPLGSAFFLPAFDPDAPDTVPDDFEDLASVNIGPQAPGSALGIGLDFFLPVEVDTVFVVLKTDPNDPDLASPAEVDNIPPEVFNWQVWTSSDQETWELHAAAPTVDYNQLENQFEISFPTAEARFLLITFDPLPTGFTPPVGKINIIDLETFTTILLTEKRPDRKLDSFEQNYNLGLSWRVTAKTFTRYDFYYQNRSSDPGDRERTLLTNSITASHRFNPIFLGTARLLRSDTTYETEDETGYEYSASLHGNYLDTFRQTLTYSGSTLQTEEGTTTSNSLLFRNVADLYLDWSAILDLGYSWSSPLAGGDTTSTLVRAGTHVQPNLKTDINLDYSMVWSTREDGRDRRKDVGRFRIQFIPLRTLSLFARFTYVNEEDEDSELLQDYRIGWSPFPDGALQFFFGYNDSLLEDGEEQTYSALTRWLVARGIFLDLTYSQGTFEDSLQESDFKSYRAELRINF